MLGDLWRRYVRCGFGLRLGDLHPSAAATVSSPTTTPFCEGRDCAECVEDGDCDEDAGEACIEGACDTPCTFNEECGLMEACDDGDCVPRGCLSDRECVLYYSNFDGGEDARLYECLPSEEDTAKRTCKVACQNDASGAEFEACEGGYCGFIGCTNDDEWLWFLELSNEPERPWIRHAVRREWQESAASFPRRPPGLPARGPGCLVGRTVALLESGPGREVVGLSWRRRRARRSLEP